MTVREPAVEGWRVWRVDPNGRLLAPVVQALGVTQAWTPRQEARCMGNDQHRPPEESCGCGWYLCPDLHTAIDFVHRCEALAARADAIVGRSPDAPPWSSLLVYARVRAQSKALPSRESFDPAGTVRVGGRLSLVGPLYVPEATLRGIRNLPLLRTTKMRPLEELTMSLHTGSPWDEVAPGLFMGGGYTAPNGFDTVVSLWGGAVDATDDPRRIRWPIVDGPAPRTDDLDQVVGWALDDWLAGRRVLVRCQLGLNRSGLVTGRMLVDAGVAPEHAVARIRAARGPRALYNRTFEGLVLESGRANRQASQT